MIIVERNYLAKELHRRAMRRINKEKYPTLKLSKGLYFSIFFYAYVVSCWMIMSPVLELILRSTLTPRPLLKICTDMPCNKPRLIEWVEYITGISLIDLEVLPVPLSEREGLIVATAVLPKRKSGEQNDLTT